MNYSKKQGDNSRLFHDNSNTISCTKGAQLTWEDAMRGFKAMAAAVLAVVAVSATLTPSAGAQGYPDRPVKLVTQGAAGSGPDVIGRIVTDHLGRLCGGNRS